MKIIQLVQTPNGRPIELPGDRVITRVGIYVDAGDLEDDIDAILTMAMAAIQTKLNASCAM